VQDWSTYVTNLFFIILYPFLSYVSVQGFNCREVGSAQRLVRAMDQECPIQHKTSLVFLLSVAASALYPRGIPALLFALLWIYHIPRMAAKKVDDALVTAMVAIYKQGQAVSVGSVIAHHLGADSPDQVEELAARLFAGAAAARTGASGGNSEADASGDKRAASEWRAGRRAERVTVTAAGLWEALSSIMGRGGDGPQERAGSADALLRRGRRDRARLALLPRILAPPRLPPSRLPVESLSQCVVHLCRRSSEADVVPHCGSSLRKL